MPIIPSVINGVNVTFKDLVNKDVDQKIIDALNLVIKPDIAEGYVLEAILISSANDQHTAPSRHVMGAGKAVDVSRINGLMMSAHYQVNPLVNAVVKAIQTEFETYPHRRENFGPFFKKKLGNPHAVGGHQDHIHMSVN